MVSTRNPEALGWKHNYEPGIETKDGVVTAWPSTLGAMPSQIDVNRWEQEYDAASIARAAKADLTAEELADILVGDGTVNRGQITAKKNSRRP